MCGEPFPFDGGYLDGAPLRCTLPAGHQYQHAVRVTWGGLGHQGGWDTPRERWCLSPYPWVAGAFCDREAHSPDVPHQLSPGVAKGLRVSPEWPGRL